MERFLIGDHWRDGSGDPCPSVNPADGSVIAEIGQAGPADIDNAVAAASSPAPSTASFPAAVSPVSRALVSSCKGPSSTTSPAA